MADADPSPRLRELLSNRDLALFLATRLIASMTKRMVLLAFGWQLYDMTHSAVSLGLAGLASFIPALILLLPSGAVADHFDRRLTVGLSFLLSAGSAALFGGLSLAGVSHPAPYYAALVTSSAAFALYRPSASSMLPGLVPREQFPAALGLAQSALLTGTLVGPVLGGLLYGFHAEWVYFAACTSNLVGALATAVLEGGAGPRMRKAEGPALQLLTGGFSYIWKRELLLGAISLDLFSSIVGGITALLPVFARDILLVGPRGLGALRSAPALGGFIASIGLARVPIRHRGGRIMFGTVILSGLATVVFGQSHLLALSMASLAVMGALDMTSSNIRQTLVQLATPDEMRGRVNAVQQMSNSTSSDLGDFISGVTAGWFGAARAVSYGGIAAIGVAALWMGWFPVLRRIDRLDEATPGSGNATES